MKKLCSNLCGSDTGAKHLAAILLKGTGQVQYMYLCHSIGDASSLQEYRTVDAAILRVFLSACK